MIIFIDMDNVLTNFTKAFVNACNEIYGDNIVFDNEKHNARWGVPSVIYPEKSVEEHSAIVERVFSTPGFWLNMNPIKGGPEAVKKLQDKGNKVYIVTMPWPTSISCFVEKYYWVKKHLPTVHPSHIIYCKDKELLEGDIIIDDRPNYLQKNGCRYTVAMDYGYNRGIQVDLRAHSWNDISEFIESI